MKFINIVSNPSHQAESWNSYIKNKYCLQSCRWLPIFLHFTVNCLFTWVFNSVSMLNIIIFNWIVQQDNTPGHTSFCEIIQHIRFTINKVTFNCITRDLEELTQTVVKKGRQQNWDERTRQRKESWVGIWEAISEFDSSSFCLFLFYCF